jgi:hypothetical protein
MNSMLRTTALTIVAGLLLTGCVKVEMDLTLSSDDTVDGYYVFAVAEGVGELMELSDEEAAEQLFGSEGEITDQFANGTVESYTADGWVGTKVSFTDESLDVLDNADQGFVITREGDEFVLVGENSATGEEEVPEGAEMSLAVTFPGAVTEHNGTLEGNTVTWDLTTATELSARGGATESSSIPVWMILAGVALVLVIAAAVTIVLVLASRRNSQPIEPAAVDRESQPEGALEPETAVDAAAEPTPAVPTADDQEQK